MKAKALLSSILVIVLCLSLIGGSTFALFTSKSNANIAVTAGEVNVVAGLEITKLESVKGDVNGTITDENGKTYSYEEVAPTFANGGTATVKGTVLTLKNITPGDKVTLKVTGANNSDVSVKYRYIIECVSGEDLMKGFVVTINEQKYIDLKSYTGKWTNLSAKTDMDDVALAIELPVTAGDEYQELDADIKITIEAIQSNGYNQDYGNVPVIEFLNGKFDLGGMEFYNTVNNFGDIAISDATIEVVGTGVADVGLENRGTAELDNIKIIAGSATDYAFIGTAGSETTLTDTDVKSSGGAIGAAGGAKVTFNSGNVSVNSSSTSGRYLFYAEGEGTVITINGGNFADFTKTSQNQKRAYIYAGAGTTVYVNGGTFGKASTRSGYTEGILGDGTVIITGGTFGFNPTKWVAPGYKAVYNSSDKTWTVTSILVYDADGTILVSNEAELLGAIATGGSLKLMADIELVENKAEITKNVTINLNNHSLTAARAYDGTVEPTCAVLSVMGVEVTITGEGTVENTSVTSAQNFAIFVSEGGKLTVKDGTYIADNAAVYVGDGEVIIEGGFFEAHAATSPDPNFKGTWNNVTYWCYWATVVNCYDISYSNYISGATGDVSKANVKISGGTFVNEDPSNLGEGTPYNRLYSTSHVLAGYTVVKEMQANGDAWYVVVPE